MSNQKIPNLVNEQFLNY